MSPPVFRQIDCLSEGELAAGDATPETQDNLAPRRSTRVSFARRILTDALDREVAARAALHAATAMIDEETLAASSLTGSDADVEKFAGKLSAARKAVARMSAAAEAASAHAALCRVKLKLAEAAFSRQKKA